MHTHAPDKTSMNAVAVQASTSRTNVFKRLNDYQPRAQGLTTLAQTRVHVLSMVGACVQYIDRKVAYPAPKLDKLKTPSTEFTWSGDVDAKPLLSGQCKTCQSRFEA